MPSIKLEAGSIQTVLSTELNSLANGSSTAAGATFDNSLTANLFLFALFELNVTFGTAPTAASLINLYILPAPDGTNFDDGSASIVPPNTSYVGGFPLRAVTTAQKVNLAGGPLLLVSLPPVPIKLLAINNSGQAFPASGSTIKMVPYRYQIN